MHIKSYLQKWCPLFILQQITPQTKLEDNLLNLSKQQNTDNINITMQYAHEFVLFWGGKKDKTDAFPVFSF